MPSCRKSVSPEGTSHFSGAQSSWVRRSSEKIPYERRPIANAEYSGNQSDLSPLLRSRNFVGEGLQPFRIVGLKLTLCSIDRSREVGRLITRCRGSSAGRPSIAVGRLQISSLTRSVSSTIRTSAFLHSGPARVHLLASAAQLHCCSRVSDGSVGLLFSPLTS